MLTAEKQDDIFFIVMEYVQGETLEEKILRDGALDVPLALDFTCQICNAVDHAHRAGILHRDLRPGNMLVSETGLLKVTDFGTSRFLEIAAHGTTIIGSPPYMAPEQFHGKAVFASDVYSIGVTMYQMLTGTLPYATPSPADLDRLMKGELVSSPRLRNPKIPKAHRRHRDARAGAGAHGALQPRRRRCSTTCWPPGRPVRAARAAAESGARRQRGRHPVAAAGPRHALSRSFCWHCRKPLQARTAKCPFCGETQ